MSKKKNILKTVLLIVVTALITTAVLLVCAGLYLKSLPVPIDNLIRVVNIIDKEYMGDYDPEKIETEMLSAVVGGLGDKYSVYYDENSAKSRMMEIDGYYIGIGIEAFANSENGKIEVISAYEGSPAYKAGIKKGDYIIKVDSIECNANTFPDAVVRMKGIDEKNPLEKEICITVEREGQPVEVTLKREKIQMNPVESEIIDGVCYIRYPGFDAGSMKQAKKIIHELGPEVTGVVVDIRNNPGGELKSAIDMCDLFIDDSDIMYTVDKSGKKVVYKATEGKCDLPLAVIVNGASASASEIFAGALQSNKRAVIVGEKTYGKGVSQSVRYVNPYDASGGAVKITMCRNYTPDGKWINESIIPDIEVKTEKTENIRNDEAFKAAVKSIKEY